MNRDNAIIIGQIPEGSKVGEGSVIITDLEFLKKINSSKGGIAIGNGAKVYE